MTNKEAIEILSVIRHSPSVDIFNKLPNSDNIIELNYKEAFDLAIKALEIVDDILNEISHMESEEMIKGFLEAKNENND